MQSGETTGHLDVAAVDALIENRRKALIQWLVGAALLLLGFVNLGWFAEASTRRLATAKRDALTLEAKSVMVRRQLKELRASLTTAERKFALAGKEYAILQAELTVSKHKLTQVRDDLSKTKAQRDNAASSLVTLRAKQDELSRINKLTAQYASSHGKASHFSNILLLGSTYLAAGNETGAEAEFRQAIKMADSPHARSIALINLARALASRGRTSEAAAALEQAIRLSINEPATQASGCYSLGLIYQESGKSASALNNLHKALSYFEISNDIRGVAIAENALGDIYFGKGDYVKSERHLRHALRTFETLNLPLATANVLTNLRKVASGQGRTFDAIHEEAEAERIYEQFGTRRENLKEFGPNGQKNVKK